MTATATIAAPAAPATPKPAPAAVERAVMEFEAVMLSQLLAPIFDGLSTDGPFGGGFGEEIHRTFLVQEISRLAAKRGVLGLADSVRRELLRTQESG